MQRKLDFMKRTISIAAREYMGNSWPPSSSGTGPSRRRLTNSSSIEHRAFKVIPIGEPIPPGYSFVRAFGLGDIKGSSTGSPELKLRFVMGGNGRPKDDIDTFLSVAHEDSPKLLFIMAYRTGQ